MRHALQLLLGLLFGTGLILSGMANPAKVLSFLDLSLIPSGEWDPSLVLVMAGGTGVTFLGYRLAFRRPRPALAPRFHLPASNQVDAAVVGGAAVFGIGWGLVGLCPGPALVALGTGQPLAILFAAAMLAGMVTARLLSLRRGAVSSPAA